MDLGKSPTIEVVLVAPEETQNILKAKYANTPILTAEPKNIRKDELHAVWYPWGSINFDCDAPAILTLHDLGVIGSPPEGFFTARKAKHDFDKDLRTAEAIIALSEWSKQQISKDLDIDPLAIFVAPPLPDPSWSPGYQDLKNIRLGEQPYVLSVAGWQDHHAMQIVIDAHYRAFHKEEITLAIYGPLDDTLKHKLHKLPHALHIEEKLDDGELRGVFRNARAVIHPATNSHWSHTAVEALCCGAPLIACDSASLPEIVGMAGFLIPEDDHQAWTSTLREVVHNQELNSDLRIAATESWGKRPRSTSLDTLIEVVELVAIRDGDETS